RTSRSRADIDLACAPTACAVMVQRAAFAQRHADHGFLGFLGRLADRLGNLARLAVAIADAALLVTDNDKRGKTEVLTAFHDLRDAVDGNQLVDDLGLFALFAAFTTTA